MTAAVQAVARWLGLPPPPRGKARDNGRRVAGVARRAGRWLVVRGGASALVWPGRWVAGATAAGGVLALWLPGWWWPAVGAAPLAAQPLKLIYGLRPRVNFGILSQMSSRVNTLRLARRLRHGWPPEMHRLGLTAHRRRRDGQTVTLTPQLARTTLTPWGVHTRVDLHRLGMTVPDLAQHRERFESVFLASCKIAKRGHGLAQVEFRHTDPLSRPVSVDMLPAPRRLLHVVTRLAEDGTGVEQDVVLPRLVIGGQGAGKSTELAVFLWALQQAGIPFRLRVFDPKGGMELGWLRQVVHRYESRPHAWGEFIGEAVAAMQSRQRSLAARGWQKLSRFTDREPLDIVVVDELLTVVSQRRAKVQLKGGPEMSAGDAWELYLSQGRAAGYTAVGLTQLGQKELLGNARALFPHLTVLRLPPSEAEIVERLLGPGYAAHEIPAGPRFAGVGFTRTPEGTVVRSRGAMLTDAERDEVVRRMGQAQQQRAQARQQRAEAANAPA